MSHPSTKLCWMLNYRCLIRLGFLGQGPRTPSTQNTSNLNNRSRVPAIKAHFKRHSWEFKRISDKRELKLGKTLCSIKGYLIPTSIHVNRRPFTTILYQPLQKVVIGIITNIQPLKMDPILVNTAFNCVEGLAYWLYEWHEGVSKSFQTKSITK